MMIIIIIIIIKIAIMDSLVPYVLITFRNLVGVKSGSDVVMLSLFWKKFHVWIACNVNELEL